MRLFGELYKPQVAILSTRGRYMMEPEDGALAAQFLMTENPELKTVIPAHHLLKGGDPDVAATPDRVEAEVKKLGLPVPAERGFDVARDSLHDPVLAGDQVPTW